MKFLADANVEFRLVEWLRGQGHDVLWGAQLAPRLGDDVLLEIARSEDRVLLTHDLDFGELVFRQRLASSSVVLMRYSVPEQDMRLKYLQRDWQELENLIDDRVFIVISEGEIRVRPLRKRA